MGLNGFFLSSDKLFGEVIAYIPLENGLDDEFEAYSAELLSEIKGVHNLYFIAVRGEGFEVLDWQFAQ